MKRLIILLLSILSISAFAQKLPDMGLYKVRINESDKSITAEIKPVKSEPSLEPDRFYNWYSSNRIKQTQGGYSGSLLNGLYNEFYLNKNLKEQGVFDKGLRDGIWKSWTEDGILIQEITWNRGQKQGGFTLYDEKGSPKQKGTYKNDLLDGKQITYNKEQVTVTIYKQGKLIPADTHQSFWSKINIFKKKHK
jgi:antitoxin component YwqK of YwqJK toxin-antitoxin module